MFQFDDAPPSDTRDTVFVGTTFSSPLPRLSCRLARRRARHIGRRLRRLRLRVAQQQPRECLRRPIDRGLVDEQPRHRRRRQLKLEVAQRALEHSK
eukprot:1473633-Prymnesium_polylepis.1